MTYLFIYLLLFVKICWEPPFELNPSLVVTAPLHLLTMIFEAVFIFHTSRFESSDSKCEKFKAVFFPNRFFSS